MHDNYRIKPNFKVNLEPRMKLKCDTKNVQHMTRSKLMSLVGKSNSSKKCCIDKKIIQNGVKSPK